GSSDGRGSLFSRESGADGKSRRHPEAERHENLYHAPTFLIGEHMVKSAPVSALPFLGLLISIRPGCAIARWRCRPSHCLKQGKPGSDVKSGQRAAENRRLLYARVSLRNHPPRRAIRGPRCEQFPANVHHTPRIAASV